MFERFTDRARRVVVLAQDEARNLGHNYIGTEHILLGLIHEGDGVAAKALQAMDISLGSVRQQVEEIIGRGFGMPSGHIPFTPRAKKVLELSLREALQLGHNYIGTEHILLGLIREGNGVAAQVLVQLGADLDRVRAEVIELLRGYQGEDAPGIIGAGRRSGRAGRRERRMLGQLLGHVSSMESRLSAVEQRVGTGPDDGEFDQQIEQARRGKEAAIKAEDFENAAILRDRERELLAEKAARHQEWASAHLDLPSVAEELRRLGEEVRRLDGLLRQHGIEPKAVRPEDGAA
jgi:ATP-dependent Clp protease ATP-binding subunit ClpC